MAEVFTVSVDGKEVDVKMTFGLLNNLCRAIGDIDGVAQINTNPDVRDGVLVQLLSPRDARGKITSMIDPLTLDIDIDDSIDLIDWAGDQVLDFFLKALERTKSLQDRNLDRIKALMPS